MKNLAQSFYTWYSNTLRNTKYRWLIVAGTLLYLFSPIDIAPDFIPILGWIDDGVVVTLLVTEVAQIMKENLDQRRVRRSAATTASTFDEQVIDVHAQG